MVQSNASKRTVKPATNDEICDILGWVDDRTVAAIRRTGASSAEVRLAFEMTDEDMDMVDSSYLPVKNCVREIFGILRTDLAAPRHWQSIGNISAHI